MGTIWLVFILFAFLAGVAIPIQFAINTQLREVVGSPFLAAAISFVVGSLFLAVVFLFVNGFPFFDKSVFRAPWWIWMGGVLGAFYVLASIVLMPKLGAAATVGFILAGQVVASIIIDHFGLIRVTTHALTGPRIFGAILIIIGAILVQKY